MGGDAAAYKNLTQGSHGVQFSSVSLLVSPHPRHSGHGVSISIKAQYTSK